MRSSLLGLALLLAGCTKPGVPSASAPLVIAPVPRGAEDAKLALAYPERVPTWPTHAADTSWVRTLPRAKEFTRVDGLATAATLGLTWRVHPSRRVAGTENDPDEYASLYEAEADLVLTAEGHERVLSLGLHSGAPDGGMISYCQRAGYHHGSPDYAFAYSEMPNRVAYWNTETMQGGTELLVLLGEGKLHVLRQYTHDGACPTRKKQGPLEVCTDMEWQQLMEIPVSGEPRVSEQSVTVDAEGRTTPLDCKASPLGEELVGPGE